ncbi:MAG: hemerythrin family protein [Spirochaetes bacterium]|nr:hemerythrin family protein [Spirochaetota bacterium]
MPILEWNRSLETGIELIDNQHQELFRRIDRLELAMYNGRAVTELRNLLEYLESYIIEHFHDEEELMLRINYPGYAAHVKEHNDFRNKINSLLAECKGKGIDSYLAIDVDKQMRKWLEHHIMKTDMAIVPFINK